MSDEVETVLEHPVIKPEDLPGDFDAEDAQLREAAVLHDSGQDIPAELVGIKSEAVEAEKKERPRDELGRFTKTEAGEDVKTVFQK